MKVYPKIGEKLYLSQRTGDYYVDMVKTPYTVVGFFMGKVLVQEAECIFPKPRYYDTLPLEIKANPQGNIIALNWSPKHKTWQYNTISHAGYPEYAHFGNWEYFPYLN